MILRGGFLFDLVEGLSMFPFVVLFHFFVDYTVTNE